MQLITELLQCVMGPKGAGHQHGLDSCLSAGLMSLPSSQLLIPSIPILVMATIADAAPGSRI